VRSAHSAELELAFLLAGSGRRRSKAHARITRLLDAADLGLLADELSARRLLPLIGSRAGQVAGGAKTDGFMQRVEAAVDAARALAAGAEALSVHVIQALEAAGIRALPLKGPFLARRAHGDPGMRIAGDIDLLVAADNLERAETLLRREGYKSSSATGTRLPELHQALEHRSLPAVDLHWRVHWYEDSFSGDMLARSTAGADGVLAATPSDELAALLLYFARDGFYGLRLAADIAAWCDRHLGDSPTQPLDQVTVNYPRLRPALETASLMVERYTGVPRSTLLSEPQPLRRRAAAAARLSNWSQLGERDQLMANISLVDGLLAPRGGASAFLRRQVFPPASEVAALRALPPTATARLAASRVTHAAKMLARFAIALRRTAGGREWMPLP
jgi:hypothetical protein